MSADTPISFRVGADWLYGMLHRPPSPPQRAVLIVVGGPQYRVGSHRQFVLLARALAGAGVAALRFDYRGMGDSEGAPRTFEHVADDIRAAVDFLFATMPTLGDVALWGLCDAASAVAMYAPDDARVNGIVLVNPWVRTEAGLARAYLKHYYWRRLLDPDLWRKLRRGEFQWAASWHSLVGMLVTSRSRNAGGATMPAPQAPTAPFTERMRLGLARFPGRILLLLSGDDITGQEFADLVARAPAWRRLMKSRRVTRRELTPANHTFARREWRDQVARWTIDWVTS
jgi:exosortase A-associated hydrolase 1